MSPASTRSPSRGAIRESILDCIGDTPLVRLARLFEGVSTDVLAKLELLNPGGSVKDRPARYIVEAALAEGSITPETHLIESSSGNFGIALAMVARVFGLQFTCVVDPNTSAANVQILRYLGANVEIVQERDENAGFLETRIRRVKELMQKRPNSYWINQYANELNAEAHYVATADELLDATGGELDVFVAPVSTTGTINGIARRLREVESNVAIVAVDAVGSVIYGGRPGRRTLPGMGASRVPELADPRLVDRVIYVSESETIRGCRDLASVEGIFAGASSGATVAAARQLVSERPAPHRIVTIFPDRGERYLDSVYHDGLGS
jgi:N-(2-amino-2-carboxyethyl)-L-glutamate synthase